jgi:hypothetical protein
MIKKKPVIIIGMHRSGTSFLSRCIEAAGVFMGHDKDVNNESKTFMHHNERLLHANNSDWIFPKEVDEKESIPFGSKDLIKHFGSYKNPVKLIGNLMSSRWGWKDPRNTFTLNYWLNIFPEAKVIHIYRNGIDVALSLQKRNKRMSKTNPYQNKALDSLVNGLKQWELYLNQAFSYQLGEQLVHVSYEQLLQKDQQEIDKLEKLLGLSIGHFIREMGERKGNAKNDFGEEHEAFQQALQASKWMKELKYSSY